jgi:four helix bundle protein
MKAHHRLKVWQRAIDFVTDIYKLTEEFPKEEIYGLVSQMRRAAVSISPNIAEGAARWSKAEFRKFLCIAQGSIAELETQVIISSKLGYCKTHENFLSELDEISRMIVGLRRSA